jgi:PhnB protein
MSTVKAVPEGCHAVTPYLCLKDAHRAIEFYGKAFGAKERFRMPTPDGKVAHAEIQIGDSIVMLSEAIQEPVTSASMYLYVPDVDDVRR